MKTKVLKSLLAIASLLCSIGVYAYDFEVDGIYYNILNETDKTIEVTYKDTGYNSYSGDIVLQETVSYNDELYYIVKIGDRAFSKCDALYTVTLPNNVSNLGIGVFHDSNNLTEIHASNGVSTNSSQIFYNCTSLKSVVIDNNTTIINDEVFRGCSSLNKITIPQNITNLGEYAIAGCSGLIEIKVEAINPPYAESNTFNVIDKSIPVYVPAESVEAYKQAEYWSEFTNIVAYTELEAGDKFTVDGIHYEVLNESGQVAVTYYGEDVWNVPEEYKYAGEVVIPETVSYQGATYSVTSIGYNAFRGCTGLTAITISNSVTSIGDYAFYACSGLTSITIPESVTSIGDYAFRGCDGLISIKVEDGNTVYDSRENCNAIIETATNTLVVGCKNTVIPNSVTSIDDYAFFQCYGLTSITIPNSVASIGDDAFNYCSGLTLIRIEAVNPPAIEESTFYYIDKTIPVYVPTQECVEAYRNAEYWSEFTNIQVYIGLVVGNKFTVDGIHYEVLKESGQVAVTYYGEDINNIPDEYKYAGTVVIPESVTYEGVTYSVTSIGGCAFANCEGLTSITIPNSVISIGNYAFASCSGLTEITIPESVASIGYEAFSTCFGLTSIVVEEDNTVYDSREDCNAIIETATNTLVAGCKKTIIPNSVTSIGDKAFYECWELTTITIPSSVTSIGIFAFYNCHGLTTITIPSSVTSIGDCAFYYCHGLTTITIPSSVTSIGYHAFYNCHGLTSITIPESVTSIGDIAFGACYGLTSIKVEEGNTVYDSREGCNAIIETATNTLVAGCKNTVIPNSVTSIGDNAFDCCRELTTITIPESVTSIGQSVFYDCNGLTSITISNSVTSIGDYAFRACYGLTSIRIEAVNPPAIEENTFSGIDKSIPVYVPTQECVEAYRNAEYWSEFTNIQVYIGLVVGNKFTVDGIHYEVLKESGQVAVTYYGEYVWNVPEEYKYAGEVVIPETVSYQGATYSVTSIGYSAFCDCDGLTSITIPNSVTSIGGDAFYACDGLTSITIPNSVTSISDNAFGACSGLTSITIPNSVASIGNSAFHNCSGLTSVTIPNSVTSIGQSAFFDCSGLTSVTIPNSVTSIGAWAFSGCSGLTSVTIPNSVTSIGYCPFSNCSGLTSIVVEEDNTVYDSREDCNAIIETATNTLVAGCKKTIMLNSVTSIGGSAFYECTGLTSITIPESVTSIGGCAFYNCHGLTSITIPNSVTSIGNEAFSHCSGLTEIRIEAVNPPTIEESTFENVDKSIPVYVPAESLEAYQSAEYWSEFTNIVAYTELEVGDKFTVDGIHYEVLNESGQVVVTYYGEDKWNVPEEYKYAGEVVIPETVSYQGATYSVTSIGNYAFQNCSGLTSITLGNGVTSIGDWAFYNCHGLTSITIPESVTSIGDCAFIECTGLTSITIPESVTSIGDGAYSGCTGLTSIKVEEGNTVYDSREGCNAIIETATNTLVAGCKKTIIPNSVTSIGDNAFAGCQELTSITIPNSVTSIGNCAFSYCYGLTSITIPESVTSIGDNAFDSCYGLTSITIPNSVTSIGNYVFDSCHVLTEITIPNSVTSIGNYAFAGNYGLTSITIPNSVTSIGVRAFSSCSGLISIKVEEGNTVYDSREGCNAIIETATNTLVVGCKNTVIPNSVTSIGNYAFAGNYGLTSITIPESVTLIGYSAFSGCTGLTSITIPNSVTSIGDWAFSSCSGLTSIRIEAVNPPAIEESTFEDVDKTIPVYVPTQECVEAYRNAEYWSEFTNIQSYTETLTYDVVVPAGTWECYIIGEFNQMSEFVPMTKINDTHYTITIEGVERSMHYQYACGNGREYVEAGDVRTYNENDVVEGWTNMPAVEAGEPEANRLQSGGVTVSRLYDVLSTARVPMVVELINEAAISALQCDIYLPEGLSVATVENGLDVAMGNRGSHDHTIDARTLDNGAIRVLVMSGTAAPLTGNAGALFTIGVIPNENYTEDAQIVICNIVMTDTDIVEYNPKQIFADCHIKESVLGDANSDGRVNVTDIVLLAKYILGGYNGNIDVLAADINQDSRINVSDIVALANLILSGKGAAGAPARQEGVQGTLFMDHVLLNTNAPTIAPMMLDNTVAYTAFQMDVIVPEGLCIEDVVCGERLTAAHNLMWKEQADGSVRIIAFATDNTPIKESQGELFHLVLSAEDGFADGEIYVSDAIFVTRGMLTHQVNDIVAGVSAPTGIEAMYSNNRVYAAHRTIVIETTCEQPAYITTIDGVSQSIVLQPGRNVVQVSQQGVYIVTVGNENKKVVVK